MIKTLFAALAATAIAAFAGTAQAAEAKNVCQWTGSDWACGDGNTFPQHVSETAGVPMIITPVPTVASNERPLLAGPRPQ